MPKQVTGGGSRLVLYRESTPKNPVAASGVLLAITSEGFKAGANKKQSGVIRGKRGAAKPTRGLAQLSGSIESPAYAPQLGHLMRALCGAPSTSPCSAAPCSAEAVADKGNGFVGIPCPVHGFIQDAVVSIVDSAHYDGVYRVERGTTVNELIIAAPYKAETLTSATTIYRGRVARLVGAAEAGASSTVILPTSLPHGFAIGDSVSIEGTTNYDGTHTLIAGTSGTSLVISNSYVAETFDGTPFAAPLFYSHTYSLPNTQPTVCIEKVLDFDADSAQNPVRRYLGCKVNSFNFALGGDSELAFSLDMQPLEEVSSHTPLNENPTELPAALLTNLAGAFVVNNVRRGDIEQGSISSAFGIEAKAAVGDRGAFSRSNEGDPDCKATLTTFLESDALQHLADTDATIPFTAIVCGAGGEELHYHLPEAELATEGVAINTRAGLMQEVQVMGFVEAGTTALTLTLINKIKSYA